MTASSSTHHPGWNSRPITHKHRTWFKNLTEINEITSAWVSELKIERPSHSIARGLPREATQDLWMVDNLGADGTLESLLDDTATEDLLSRLERTVWSVQAWTLRFVAKAGAQALEEESAVA